MSRFSFIPFLFIVGILFLCYSPPQVLQAGEETPHERYWKLVGLYTKWNDGLFGGKKYHETHLRDYLEEILGKEIRTDASFKLTSPEGLHDETVECMLSYDTWLYIKGPLDVESLKEILADDPDLLKTWWRSNTLVSVSGKIRKYKLDYNKYGDIIILYLHTVKLNKGDRVEEE